MTFTKLQKKKVVEEFKVHENDTGSCEVQIAILTSRIKNLTEHLKKNKKDFSCAVSLVKMVEKRKKFLKYIKQHNFDSYASTIEKLGIRK